jgi:ATP-dependent exoDNAse (exonuclease V) beta subunit
MMLMRVDAPAGEDVNRTRRRTGPKGVFVGGRVDWERLHERATGAATGRAAEAVAKVAAPALAARPPTYVTATALNTYQDCAARFHWEAVLGLQSPEASERVTGAALSPVELGNIFHRAMELAASAERAVVAGAAEAAVREAGMPAGADAAKLAVTVAEAVGRFWRSDLGHRLAKAPPADIHREMPLVLRVGQTEVGGKIDLLFRGSDGAWELVDYKSGRPEPDKAANAAAAYGLQLGLYAMAASRWLGSPIARWSVYFDGSGVTATHDVTDEDLRRAEGDARQALEGIAARRFGAPADGKGCGQCRFRRLCRR